MRFDITLITIIFCATLAAACTGTPRNVQPAPGTVTPPQPQPKVLAAANSAPAAEPVVVATTADKVDPILVKAGYTVLRRHGEIRYCRSEIITGQRIGSWVCLSAAQIQVEKQNVTKARDLMNQSNYSCLGGSCKDPCLGAACSK